MVRGGYEQSTMETTDCISSIWIESEPCATWNKDENTMLLYVYRLLNAYCICTIRLHKCASLFSIRNFSGNIISSHEGKSYGTSWRLLNRLPYFAGCNCSFYHL